MNVNNTDEGLVSEILRISLCLPGDESYTEMAEVKFVSVYAPVFLWGS